MSTVKDLFENEELMNVLVEDIEDFPEEAEVRYAVWALGYDEDDEITDAEFLIGEFGDPDDAIACADKLTFEALDKEFAIPSYVAHFSIEVETVVEVLDDEDESFMNVGTIYHKEFKAEGHVSIPILAIRSDECAHTDDGNLKIACELMRDFNKNDLVRIQFIDIPDSDLFIYKVISKVEYADGDYYHCELQL